MHIEFLWGKGIFIYEKELKINTNYIKDSVLKNASYINSGPSFSLSLWDFFFSCFIIHHIKQ